ncbi:MAG: hypothetical protein PHQ34_01785 [Methanothrix sp.]|nr:hypothetical protein [Methanothrix sp.]
MLIAITSLLGIFFEGTYSRETKAWAVQALGQDYANLVVVIILIASTYFLSKESLRAYLVWLGAYIYIIYVFAIYAFAVHFNFLFLIYILILGASFFTIIGGLKAVDTQNLASALRKNTRSRMVSALLMLIAIMFSALWLSEIVPYLLSNEVPPVLIELDLPTNPVHVLDLAFILPGTIVVSALLWRRETLGLLLAVPLLVFMATMGAGIIAMFVLSASNGGASVLPAGLAIGTIMLLSTLFSYLFLKEIKRTISINDLKI